jgi:hypothetical protein
VIGWHRRGWRLYWTWLFVVLTIGFKTLYVLFLIRHGRRELLHAGLGITGLRNLFRSPRAHAVGGGLYHAYARGA